MRMTRRLAAGPLLVLLLSASSAHAIPILYRTTGQIQLGDGAYEDFVGSFVLSDPIVRFFEGDDSRGDEVDVFRLSDFTISSASYSLTGQGSVRLWWALDDEPVWINRIDSLMRIDTPLGGLENWSPEAFGRWEGTPGVHPTAFSGFRAPIGLPGASPSPGRVQNMSAVRAGEVARVPEPSLLLLSGLGMAGFGLFRLHRRRSRNA